MAVFASPTLAGDYQSLANAIADELNRQDLLTSIPNFIALANLRASRDLAALRHQASMKTTPLTLTSEWTALPADFLAVYQLSLASGGYLQFISAEEMRDLKEYGQSTGQNVYFTIINDGLVVYPAPSVGSPLSVTLWYYAALPALNATTTTHWASTRYPDLFFYGALVHSAPYLKADERIQTWETAYQAILTTISIEASRGNAPQSFLTARARAF